MSRHLRRGPGPQRGARVHVGILAALLVIALGAAAVVALAGPTPGPVRAEAPTAPAPAGCRAQTADFPRTATVYLSQDNLPPVAELARYDVVVVDQEWQERDPQYLADLRAADPGVCVIAHMNLVDRPNRVGTQPYWAGRYRLWQFTDDVTSDFPVQWQARTAAGTAVSEWPESTMANISDLAPPAGGQTYAQHASDWVVAYVLSSGVWDGVFLDVWGDRIFTADAQAWDVAGDGVDVPAEQIYGPGGPWERGATDIEAKIRARAPDTLIIANGQRTVHPGLLDGLAWESFADPQSDRDVAADLTDYWTKTSTAPHRLPGMAMTINKHPDPHSGANPQVARFQLAATLMQNGFWAPMGADYGFPEYYPELGGGTPLGRGYLGQPIAANPTPADLSSPFRNGVGRVGPDVTRRDFTNGIVLLNAGTSPQTVQLGGDFRTLSGESVSSVTVAAQDGAFLTRP